MPSDFKNHPIEIPDDIEISLIQRQNMMLRMMLQTAAIRTKASKRDVAAPASSVLRARKFINTARAGGKMRIGQSASTQIRKSRLRKDWLRRSTWTLASVLNRTRTFSTATTPPQ